MIVTRVNVQRRRNWEIAAADDTRDPISQSGVYLLMSRITHAMAFFAHDMQERTGRFNKDATQRSAVITAAVAAETAMIFFGTVTCAS